MRSILSAEELNAEGVTRFDDPSKNQLQIRLSRIADEEKMDLNEDSRQVFQALKEAFDSDVPEDRLDLNNATAFVLTGCFRNVLQGEDCRQEVPGESACRAGRGR